MGISCVHILTTMGYTQTHIKGSISMPIDYNPWVFTIYTYYIYALNICIYIYTHYINVYITYTVFLLHTQYTHYINEL